MINLKEFYRGFQVNYFDYKAAYLQHALENIDTYNISDIIDASSNDLKLAIKSDIRQNYYLALETLFTLVFCLCPDKHGIINDVDILKRIINFKIPPQLELMASNEEGLDFLNQEIRSGSVIQSLIEYIFYYNVTDEAFKEEIPASIDAIKYGLQPMAKDFSDRREYNSYKHGLRSFPFMSTFSLSHLGSWDIKDSLTYYSEEFDKGTQKRKITFTTKVFDTMRDLKMTSVCSSFIWNIIRLRNATLNEPKKVRVLLFDKEHIREAQQQNTTLGHVAFSIEV